MSTKDIYSTLN